jgi:membrane peptidoglycan carboxypeptidase
MRVGPIASWVRCGVLGGLVLAVVAFPGAAVAGLLVEAASSRYLDLPSDLETPLPAQTSYVYANDGRTLITTFYDQDRHDVALSAIAPVMRQAIVAAEDARFYEHGAVDLRSMLRALVSDSRSGRAAQGASTLTMQYVRNVLINDPDLSSEQ